MTLIVIRARTELYIGGRQRRLVSPWNTTAGVRSLVATASLTILKEDGAIWPGQPVLVRAGEGTALRDIFAGEIAEPGYDLPPGRTFSAVGYLGRTRKGSGVEDATAYGPSDPTLPMENRPPAALAFANQTARQIIAAILGLYRITRHDLADSGRVFAALEPVYLLKDEPGINLIKKLDEEEGYQTFDDPSGVVRRVPLAGVPAGSPARTWVQGVDLERVSRRQNRDEIANRVVATGIQGTAADGTPYQIEAEVYAPPVNDPTGHPYIQDPPGQTYTFDSPWLETYAQALAYATRKHGEMNRLTETLSGDLARGDSALSPGMTVAMQAAEVELTSASRYWLEELAHRGAGPRFSTSVTLRGQTTSSGADAASAPLARFTYRVGVEWINGAYLYVVSFDATSSVALATPGLASYAWSGSPVTPTPTGPTGKTATAAYTIASPAPTVTLTVTDQNGRPGSVTQTLDLVGVNSNTRDLWLAVGARLYYSGDGGKTWSMVAIAAVGCCREAGETYQLAWTAAGALHKVRVDLTSTNVTPSGAVVTAAWISYSFGQQTWTGVCYAGCADGKVYRSVDDGLGWTLMGTIPGGLAITDISESPTGPGQVQATAGNALWLSYDAGATWSAQYTHPDSAAQAQRFAGGFGQGWTGFSGADTTGSHVVERSGTPELDLPSASRPARVRGLQLAVYEDTLYLLDVDGSGNGRAWVADAAVGGVFTAKPWPAGYGAPLDMVRDGKLAGLVYVGAERAALKALGDLATYYQIKAMLADEDCRMIGFGALKPFVVPIAPIAPTTIASVVGAEKVLSLWNGSSNNAPPANWYTNAFDDSAWGASVAGPPSAPMRLSGGQPVWMLTSCVPFASGLFRRTFTLPLAMITTATLQVLTDNITNEVYVNGTALSVAANNLQVLTWDVKALLVSGALNVLAIRGSETVGSESQVAYVLTVS